MEDDDPQDTFVPESGNVLFASAVDGWAFGLASFAAIYAQKLGASRPALQKTLWGDYYYNPKTRRVLGRK